MHFQHFFPVDKTHHMFPIDDNTKQYAISESMLKGEVAVVNTTVKLTCTQS